MTRLLQNTLGKNDDFKYVDRYDDDDSDGDDNDDDSDGDDDNYKDSLLIWFCRRKCEDPYHSDGFICS